MKVRHRQAMECVREAVDESAHYYVLEFVEPYSHRIAVPKSEWEPVPTETWRDVTGEIEVCGNMNIMHEGKRLTAPTDFTHGYRLRKVSGSSLAIGGQRWAFIIEKRDGAAV